MPNHQERSFPLMLLALAGLLVSVLASAIEFLPTFQFLCPTACRETAEIVLLHMPVWAWGTLFWTAVLFLAWFKKEWIPWIAAPAAGMEAALVWIMLRMGVPCVFCIMNAVVVALVLAFSLRKRLLWQQTALALLFLLVSVSWIPYENRLFATPVPPAGGPEPGIAARVGDEVITDHRLEVLLGSRLFDMKREIYRVKKEKLDQLIIETLLQKEAKEKGKTMEQLMEEVAPAVTFTSTNQEIDRYLRENQEQLKNWTPEMMPELRNRVKVFLENQKRGQAVNAYAKNLEPKYNVKVYLGAPQIPLVQVPLAGIPSIGPADAPVTVVEFSDYECPACRGAHETVKRVRAEYGNKLRWYFQDYPLRQHKHAFKAAEAAHCAADHGKFWEYQNVVFTRDKLDPEDLVKYAAELGIPAETFRACLQAEKHKATVEQNLRDATVSGVDRTPSFIINGQLLTGALSFEAFKAKIEAELQRAGKP